MKRRQIRTEDILLIDLDGTLVDFEARLLELMEHRSGGQWVIPVAERQSHHVADDYQKRFGTRAGDLVRVILADPQFFAGMRPIAGACGAVHELESRGWYVALLSAPITANPTCGYEKQGWVAQYLGDRYNRRLILAKDKSLVRGRYLIDDREQFGTMDPTWEHLIFEAPTNRELVGTRIRDWGEALDLDILRR